MLKIKKNISPQKLKEKLLKLGFIESWDYIGMIKHADAFRILDPSISIKDRNITINIYGELFNDAGDAAYDKQINFVADTLFDLIQAGLVERVKN